MSTKIHQPVLLAETIDGLSIQSGQWYLDATFGRGGHTAAILAKGGNVIAFDWDTEAIAAGQERFNKEIADENLHLVHSSFANLKTETQNIQKQKNIKAIMGILFDFGTSTEQLTSGTRGFSFLEDGELDMRMDTRLGVQAKDLLNVLPEKQLITLFQEYGGELEARAVAKAIKASKTPITRTTQLASVVAKAKHERRGHLHPATKVFQALRIAVNMELDEIISALPQALDVVASGGIIATIAFHEGEDRLAKHSLRNWAEAGKGELLSKKAISASEAEVLENTQARSAKLRLFRKN